MSWPNALRLTILAAIWGGSFIFMRVLSPAIGALRMSDFRVLVGGIVLFVYLLCFKKKFALKKHWKRYLFIGLINTSIPFYLYAYAALKIPASYSAIFNSTAPIFGTIFSVMLLSEKITRTRIIGLFIGVAGVVIMSLKGPVALSYENIFAMACCVAATMCYGFGSVYVRRYCKDLESFSIAACSQLLAGLLVFPLTFTGSIVPVYDLKIVACILAVGILCGSIAFYMYYRLITDIGPAKSLTVTFLIPIFGMFWAWYFLDEEITWAMGLGMGVIILGTYLTVKKDKNNPVETS